MFTKLHYNRLNKLADRIQRARRFDMEIVEHDCGTPACVAGHALAEWKAARRYRDDFTKLYTFLTGIERPEYVAAGSLFGWAHIFSAYGCDFAGKNNKKAARYIRNLAEKLQTGNIT